MLLGISHRGHLRRNPRVLASLYSETWAEFRHSIFSSQGSRPKIANNVRNCGAVLALKRHCLAFLGRNKDVCRHLVLLHQQQQRVQARRSGTGPSGSRRPCRRVQLSPTLFLLIEHHVCTNRVYKRATESLCALLRRSALPTGCRCYCCCCCFCYCCGVMLMYCHFGFFCIHVVLLFLLLGRSATLL